MGYRCGYRSYRCGTILQISYIEIPWGQSTLWVTKSNYCCGLCLDDVVLCLLPSNILRCRLSRAYQWRCLVRPKMAFLGSQHDHSHGVHSFPDLVLLHFTPHDHFDDLPLRFSYNKAKQYLQQSYNPGTTRVHPRRQKTLVHHQSSEHSTPSKQKSQEDSHTTRTGIRDYNASPEFCPFDCGYPPIFSSKRIL